MTGHIPVHKIIKICAGRRAAVFFSAAMASAVFFAFGSFAQETNVVENKKRDPFVALVNASGKIKTDDELFPVLKKKTSLSMNITLKAIIWDSTRPVAFINTKNYHEGDEITEGLKIQKINPNDIVLNDNGSLISISLRKMEKK